MNFIYVCIYVIYEKVQGNEKNSAGQNKIILLSAGEQQLYEHQVGSCLEQSQKEFWHWVWIWPRFSSVLKYNMPSFLPAQCGEAYMLCLYIISYS